MKRVSHACLLATVLAALTSAAFAQLSTSSWPKFHRDLCNTGQAMYGGTGSDLSWSYSAGSAIRSAPVIGLDGTSYFACDDGRLYAISGSGTKLWDYNCGCLGSASPALASDGTIYLGCGTYLYAISSAGAFKWRLPLTGRAESSVTVGTDGTVYFGTADSKLWAVNPLTHTTKWTFATGGSVASSPAIGSDGTLYFGCSDGAVYAVYASGTQRWKCPVTGSGGFAAAPAIGSDGTIYIGSLGGSFYAIRANGTRWWTASAGGAIYGCAAVSSSGAIYFGSRDRKLHALSSTGTEQWAFTTGHYIDSSPAVGSDGGVFFGSMDGNLYSLNPDGTERWHYPAGSAISSSPAIGPAGALIVGADNGTLYCFAADSTPPGAPTVTDDGAYTSVLDRIHASWTASDPESGISSYEFCIGTQPGATDIAGWTSAGGATQYTKTGLSLQDKQTYYVTVRAINGAGLSGPEASSDGIIADATPPTAPVVVDEGQFTSSASTLSASWSATDPECGIAAYQYSIGTSAGSTNVAGWTDAGAATSVTRSGLELQGGTRYYFNVKAKNTGGAWGAVGSSDGITVDVTPPTKPVVTDSGQFWADQHSLKASWTSSDNESGLSKFEYSVGTAAGSTNVVAWTSAGTSTMVTITGLNLTNGGVYYINVRATNGALLVSDVGSSDGITVELAPPDAPVVTDDGDYTASTSQLHATWTSSVPASGIAGYRYAIGTSSGATDVVGWTDAGAATSVTRTGLTLTHGQRYYFSVVAISGAGAQSSPGNSDGITVDATAPTRPTVTDDGAYTLSSTELHATWDATDADSGIQKFEYSIGTSAGGTDVVAWTNAGTNKSVTRTGLTLHDGTRYYFNVRAYNLAGTVSEIGSSDGITVDLQIPPAPAVTDDGAFTASGTSLHFTWTSVTCPSGIAAYEYAVGTTSGGTQTRSWTNAGLVTEFTASGLALQSGTTYYISVRGKSSLGATGLVGTSDGILVDTTAPPAPSVTDGGAWSASATQLTAAWSCSDPESGIAEYQYAVGTSAHGTQTRNWTSAGTDTSLTIASLALADGGTYYVSVRAKNGAGSTGPDGTTDGIRIDLTPPTKPVVTDDGTYTTNATQLHARWTSTDPQSGIVRYECSIGTTAGGSEVKDWTSVGTATETTVAGLALQPATLYSFNVRAVNGAGANSEVGSSDGIYVESTPPTTPVVTDDGKCTRSTTTLHASWTSEDPETGIAKFEYCIGTQPDGQELANWTDIGTATSVQRTDLSLEQGQTYYISVRATNGIGMLSEVGSSDGITVDTTPPNAPAVTDDGEFASSTSELHVLLECSDDESGVASYECAVGTTSGGTDIADWTAAGAGPDATISGLSLTHGSKYYVSARATNGAGIVGAVGTSDGITIDTTAPVGLVVIDDGAFTGLADRLHARWSASDPESGIARYRYCIGTEAGRDDVASWLDAGNATEDTRTGLSLASGSEYYVTVIATNGAGADGIPASSDGIRLDLSAPTTPVVTDTGRYWGYRTSIWASWQSADPESGIAEYSMSVGTSAGATDVADWASVGNVTAYTRTGVHLTDGVTYYVNIKARNGAGQWSLVGSSDGVVIDSTPPTTPVVVDDGDTQAMLDSLHATWLSEDPESGIAEYVYCIGTSPGATDVKSWTSAGTSREATVTDLQLDPVLRYYFSVKARSGAGAWSAVSASDGIGYTSGVAIWAKFRSDSRNMGRGLFNATRVNEVAWIVPTQGYVESSPTIAADGTTYVGSGDGKLYAITQNGTLRWTHDVGSPVDSSPTIAPDRSIVVGCEDGRLLCLNPAGELLWSHQTGGSIRASAVVQGESAYISGMDGTLYAVNLSSGQRRWAYSTGGPMRSSPAVDSNGVVYVASEDSCLHAVNPNGTLRWKYRTGSATDASPAIGPDGTVYVGSGDGFFYAIKPDGTLRWRFDTAMIADSSAAIGPDGSIYFGVGFDGGNGRLYALRADGTMIWQHDLAGGGIVSSPAIDPSGMIYVGACNSRMYAFNPDGTVQWSYLTQSSVISSPALGADSSVVFGSYDGSIYCLRDITSKDLTPPTTPVVAAESTAVAVGQAIGASWISTDPDTMVAEYTYAVGTAQGSADVSGWVSTGIERGMSRDDLPLIEGQTYYVSVKARNPSQRWSEIGVSEGITIMPAGFTNLIGEIKNRAAGVTATLSGKVLTEVFSDCFFIEEPSRCSGIRCVGSGTGLKAGDRVSVSGTLASANGEKLLEGATFSGGSPGQPLAPVWIAGRALKAGGPDPLGLYVTVCGKVTSAGDDYLVIDIGSALHSPRGGVGLEVRCSGTPASAGNCVAVSGVLCRDTVAGEAVPVLRTADNASIRLVNP